MAGKSVILTRAVRIKNKRRKAGDKVQVDADTLAELEALNAIEAASKGDSDDEKEGK